MTLNELLEHRDSYDVQSALYELADAVRHEDDPAIRHSWHAVEEALHPTCTHPYHDTRTYCANPALPGTDRCHHHTEGDPQ